MWGMVLFWDFLLGLLRTWNIGFGVFWGDFVGLRQAAALLASPYRCCACGTGASLSRLGKLYFGRGYREDCVIGLLLWG